MPRHPRPLAGPSVPSVLPRVRLRRLQPVIEDARPIRRRPCGVALVGVWSSTDHQDAGGPIVARAVARVPSCNPLVTRILCRRAPGHGPARWPVARPVGHRLNTFSLARWLSLPPRRGRARALWVALAAAPVGVGAGSISRLVRAGTACWPVARPVGHRLNRLSLACGSTRWPSFDTLSLACGIARWPWAGAFMWACGSMAIGSTHAIARLSSREAFTVLAVIVGLSLPPRGVRRGLRAALSGRVRSASAAC